MVKRLIDYQFQNTIGQGTFGKVKQAIHIPTNERVAIKILQKQKIVSKKDGIRVQRELNILKKINHPNIVRLLDVRQSAKSYFLITELADGKQLYQLINQSSRLSQKVAAQYFLQLLDAICYLHSHKICHRDIKPQNIIVSDNQLKLIDFGFSSSYSFKKMLQTSCGSPCYAAPEMMEQGNYNPEKSDVWALGITLYAMLSGTLPFEHSNTNKLYKLMITNNYNQIEGISSSLRHILRAMIQVNPNERISLAQIRDHIWIKSFNYQFFEEKLEQPWNQNILKQLQKVFNKPIDKLKDIIKIKPSKQRVYYHLLLSKKNNNKNFQITRFAYHLNFIFHSQRAVLKYIAENEGEVKWKSQIQFEGANHHGIIETVGQNLYYLSYTNNII